MRVKQHREATLKRYLLGELDEEPRLEVEERLVMDPEFFELLGPSEDELTEEYLEGVLSPAERMAFERHFLINEDRRWQVGFVRLLKDRASAAGLPPTEMTAVTRTLPLRVERSSAQGVDRTDAHAHLRGREWKNLVTTVQLFRAHPLRTGVLAASVAILLAGTSWFAVRGARLAGDLGRLRTEHETAQREQHALKTQVEGLSSEAQAARQTELDSERRQHANEALAPGVEADAAGAARRPAPPTFVLATGLLRSEGAVTRIAIPSDASVIRLRLHLAAAGNMRYRTVLYNAESVEMWAQSGLKAQGDRGRAAITVILPAELLSRGDYLIKVSGTDGEGEPEPLASYSFRVTAQ